MCAPTKTKIHWGGLEGFGPVLTFGKQMLIVASLHSACKSKGGEAGAALPVLELAILLASLVMIPLGAEPLPRLALILEECQRGSASAGC